MQAHCVTMAPRGHGPPTGEADQAQTFAPRPQGHQGIHFGPWAGEATREELDASGWPGRADSLQERPALRARLSSTCYTE